MKIGATAKNSSVKIDQIYPDLVVLLYRRSRVAILVSLLNSLILVVFIYDVVDLKIVGTWFGLQLVFSIFRILYNRRVLSTGEKLEEQRARKLELHFIIMSAISGALWGSIALFPVVDEDHLHYLTLMIFLIGGMMAGAAISMSPSSRSFFTFTIACFIPFFYRLFTFDDQVSAVMGIFILIFVVAILTIARENHLNIKSILSHRYFNDRLLNNILALNDDLQDAKRTTEKALQARSLFLASMSHEIRTPLNSIIGFTDILNEVVENEEHQKQIKIINNSGHHLLNLINEILDYSAIESGQLKFNITTFPLNDLLYHVAEMLEQTAIDKELDLVVKSSRSIDYDIVTDQNRLRQAIINLISNALKYTPSGWVALDYELENSSDQTWLTINVSDTGLGIPQEKHSSIFKEYSRVKSEQTSKISGTGLGLAIVKKVIEGLKGTVGFTSSPETGSNFWIKIPVKISTSYNRIQQAKPYALEALKSKRAMVCGLPKKSADYLSTLLQELGLQTKVSNESINSIELKRLLENGHFCFICQKFLTQLLNNGQLHLPDNLARQLVVIINISDSNSQNKLELLAQSRSIQKPFQLEEIMSVLDLVDSDKTRRQFC